MPNFTKPWALEAAGAALLLAVLSTLASGIYFSGDDPQFLHNAVHAPHLNADILLPVGRWLNLALIDASFGAVAFLSELERLRYLSALFLVAQFLLAARLLGRLGEGRPAAAAISALAILVPSTMPILAWAQHWTVAAGAVLMTAGAWMALEATEAGRRTGTRTLAGAGAVAAFYLAGSINQSLLGFAAVWAFAMAAYAPGFRSAALRGGATLAGLGASLVLCLVTAKAMQVGDGGRAQLALDPTAKLLWFAREPLVNALSTFFLRGERPNFLLAAATGAATLALFLTAPGRRSSGALVAAAFLFCLPLAYVANLAVEENWASYRSIWPLATLCTLALCVGAVRRLRLLVPSAPARHALACALLLAVGGKWAWTYEQRMRAPYAAETASLAERVRAVDVAGTTRIRVVTPTWSPKASVTLYDDIGVPNIHAWTPDPALRLMAEDPHFKVAPSLGRLPVDVVPFDRADDPADPGTAVVDMRLAD